MRCNLVPFGYHPLDDGGIGRSCVNRSFAKIVSCDKKRRVKTILLQCVKQPTGVEVRSIIISQSHHVLLNTVIDVIIISDASK